MSKALVALLVCSFGLAPADRRLPDRLHFKSAGFSIRALESRPGNVPYQALVMFLPPSEGFPPNVNVQIQPWTRTLDEYVALSKRQYKAAKFTLLKETSVGETAVVLECSGTMQGRQLHWYARAISTGKKMYLVTATATESQWQTVSGQLKACVDSLKIEKSLPTTLPDRAAPPGSGAGTKAAR